MFFFFFLSFLFSLHFTQSLEAQATRERKKLEQIKYHMSNQVREQAERAEIHEGKARQLEQALRDEEQKRQKLELRLEKELEMARGQVESKIGEVANKAREEEARLIQELEDSKATSKDQTTALQVQLDAQLQRSKRLEAERFEAKSEASRNERVLWEQQEKAQKLHESLEASQKERKIQEERAKELASILEEQEQKRWALESQLNAARAQASSRDDEIAVQVAAAGKAKEDQLMEMISDSRKEAQQLQQELSEAVAAERREKERIQEAMRAEAESLQLQQRQITKDLLAKVKKEEKRREKLETTLQAEIKETTKKLTGESMAKQARLEAQIQESNDQLNATKNALEAQLDVRGKQLEEERIAREEIEITLAREEKKRAALKRHLKNKLKEQMKLFEKERREMATKYEEAMDAARSVEQKQSRRATTEQNIARNEIVALASSQNNEAVKKLEKELAEMRTQLELQRQHTVDARQEVVKMRQGDTNTMTSLSIARMDSSNGVQLTPRHEKMQKMHIQHEVERETHHERVRQEKARQRAMLKERLERKRGEDRPQTTAVAPGQRPMYKPQPTSAWGGEVEAKGEELKMGGSDHSSKGGGRGKNLKNLFSSGEGSRQIIVRSKRPVVDFTADSDSD